MQRPKLEPGRWDLDDALPRGAGRDMQDRFEAMREKAARFEKLRIRLDGFKAEDVGSTLGLYGSIVDELKKL
ncbi:MAG: hypothetical protein ACLQEQ_06940 [Nitrososphaerales archaeon]